MSFWTNGVSPGFLGKKYTYIRGMGDIYIIDLYVCITYMFFSSLFCCTCILQLFQR